MRKGPSSRHLVLKRRSSAGSSSSLMMSRAREFVEQGVVRRIEALDYKNDFVLRKRVSRMYQAVYEEPLEGRGRCALLRRRLGPILTYQVLRGFREEVVAAKALEVGECPLMMGECVIRHLEMLLHHYALRLRKRGRDPAPRRPGA
ncbi:hypothetical protein A3770_08p50490 [Chloropicon primus]|uniref:Uncharacterized protein n=2 Tax=Chloropicon primus TaxID=1764295 RepID=A0A5B8MQ97_9CHLO|nr:hypothetical protein A3770_08p50490 [Chloropicon primus]|eukprot:QDZ22531.1 hypothetical protein A3770_08p50490 [Chloropicon primus]